jgi:hypothetical protein
VRVGLARSSLTEPLAMAATSLRPRDQSEYSGQRRDTSAVTPISAPLSDIVLPNIELLLVKN